MKITSYILFIFGKLKYKTLFRKNYNRVNSSDSFQCIISAAKHEAHKLEKAFFAGYFADPIKISYYDSVARNLKRLLNLLRKKFPEKYGADINWISNISDNYPNFDNFKSNNKGFMESASSSKILENKLLDYYHFYKGRRSSRKWMKSNNYNWVRIGDLLINIAKWAPTSGNRQPWVFKSIISSEDKNLFNGIKEKHALDAPLIILVGVNRDAYGILGRNEAGTLIDGAAASMSIIDCCHYNGLQSCWNHFGFDLIYSRFKNYLAFQKIKKHFKFDESFIPISIISIGFSSFINIPPERKEHL